MDERPLVTIGMCVKNGEEYIKEAIKSVSDQDLPHELMEIVLVDERARDYALHLQMRHDFLV